MSEQRERSVPSADEYTVRRLRPDDIDGLLALDRAVWDRRRSETWFEWKYAENPYLDHIPIFVSEVDGTIVGARPFMVFRLRVGDDTLIALQPSDTMVHPDHRRRGLFTRMTERAIDYYADRRPALFFNFPNEQAVGGYEGLGWRIIGPRMVYYRVQNPAPFLANRVDGSAGKLLGALSGPTARGYYRARRRFESPTNGFVVDRLPTVPIDMLVDLYERAVPCQIHAHRDERYYEWCLNSPEWEYVTHVARRGGTPIAAIVSRRRSTDDGVSVVQLAEVVPLGGDRTWSEAVRALVSSVIEDESGVDLVSAVESAIPRRILSAYGFRPGHSFPFRGFRAHRSSLAVRPIGALDDDSWRINGRLLADRKSWLFSFCEHDTA